MRLGCEKNVIVLTQCAQYRKKPNELMPLIRAKYRRYPKLIELMATRHLRYNETLEEIEALKQQGKVLCDSAAKTGHDRPAGKEPQ